ncbi:sugar ABC transporter permease [Catenulispora subtropica]|uniref:Sugar ABC transporter permease n=1 Tax=Catenulispora subtropica TaxID=450798 RepID=A0ABP5C5N5_9ACTN
MSGLGTELGSATPTPAAGRSAGRRSRPPGRGSQGRQGGKSGGLRIRTRREAWLFMAPALIPIALFSVYPLLRGIWLGFTDTKAGYDITSRFNGFDNYVRLWHDTYFWQAFRNGLIWAFAVTVLQFCLALGLALLLNERLRMRWLARTLALVPWAMPPVIVAIMWQLVYNPDAGLLNEILMKLHITGGGTNWLGQTATVFPAIIVVGVWAGMPQTTVSLLAGLQSIPGELYEAGTVDGAGSLQRFRHITLPQLGPVIATITSLDFVWNFNSFGLVYVLTDGGPAGKTTLPMLLAYNEAFKYGDFSYAAAMGDAMVLLILALLGVYLRLRMKET